ncbi:nudix hydrolase 2-like [Rutidosis leptorrhynchoides]|uniref:nudix hydrolase 2-like n=1 Tax=Rutidosis leptorrhynchoides TaxID=125765 RepID=UPI003A99F103
MEPLEFVSVLEASIQLWKNQGKKGIWIKLPIEHANLIESAVKQGFWYHHAEPKYLMLVNWLPGGSHTLPANATHRVGIGAFVMNKKREILVVQEKGGKLKGTGFWKIPTGVVEEGEDICTAAVREVKEETGVDTEFIEVLAFRQSHKAYFEKSDLFFVCLSRPLSSAIQMQETEIEAAQWMSCEEYAATPFVKKHELAKYIVDICLARIDGKYPGFSAVPTTSDFNKDKSVMYLDTKALYNK